MATPVRSALATLAVLLLLTACGGLGMRLPAKELDAGEQLAWSQCERFAEADYNAFQRLLLAPPKEFFQQCMEVHGYKLVENDEGILPKGK